MSASPTKEVTPTDPKATFTDKEQKLIVAAMFCLKSGPPEIDYTKFQKAGDFNTLKTASNTWGKIKAKMNALSIDVGEAAENGESEGTPTKKTPTKSKTTPKKRGKKTDDDVAEGEDDDQGDGETKSPSKKVKKTPGKKGGKKATAAKEEDGDGEVKAEDEDE